MLEFVADLFTSGYFQMRLAGLGGDLEIIDRPDFEKISAAFDLLPQEKASLEKFKEITATQAYLSPEIVREKLISVLKPAAGRKNRNVYGLFRNLFGKDLSWKSYFPNIDEECARVEADIKKKLDSVYIKPQFYDANDIVNTMLSDVGSELSCYVFREDGCYICGFSDSETKKIEDGNARILTFETVDFEKCPNKKLHHLGQFDDLGTVAVFVPRLKHLYDWKLMHYLPGFLSGFVKWLVSKNVSEFVKNHELGHVYNDNRAIDIVVKYADLELVSKNPDIKKLYELYLAGKEVLPDIYALQNTTMGKFAYNLVRSKNYPGLTDLSECESVELNEIQNFFNQYKVAIDYEVGEFIKLHPGIFEEIRAGYPESVKSVYYDLEEGIQFELDFAVFAEMYWKDKTNLQKMKKLGRDWWLKYKDLTSKVCVASAGEGAFYK